MKTYVTTAKTYVLPAISALAIVLGATSCDMLEKIPKIHPTPKKEQPQSGKSSRDVLPQDRTQFILDKASKTYMSDQLRRGVVAGDWTIEQVNGHDVSFTDQAPYLKFEQSGAKYYGNSGCNYFSGTYKYDLEQKTLSFSAPLATQMLCPDSALEIEIFAALAKVTRYSWEADDNSFYLYLYGASETPVMKLMHQDFAFLNGVWTVKALNDEPINTSSKLRFVIDINDGTLHGNTGCNVVNGRILTDMDAPNSISFQQITTQGRTCPEIDYENELIVAFEDASTAKPISADKVLLINNHGVVVLELERLAE